MPTRWSNYGLTDFGLASLGRELFNLGDLRREMDRLFEDFDRGAPSPQRRSTEARASWPRFSLDDTGEQFLLWAEVPGIEQGDLSVTVEQNVVSVRGERKAQAPQGYSVHRQERGRLSFARNFTLPGRINAENVRATLENGVLQLTLPRVAEEQPRQITVQAS